MITAIKETVSEHFDIPASQLSVSKFFHSSEAPSAKVLFLVTDGQQPVCLIKMMRDATFNDRLKHEINGQRQARSELTNFVVPEVFLTTEISGRYVVAEAVMDGTPVGRDKALSYIDQVYSYQQQIPKASEFSIPIFVEAIRDSGINSSVVTQLIYDLQSMDCPLYRAWTHGDLTFMNIIRTGNRLAIIDWERYGERPVWGIDLVHYLVRAYGVSNRNSFKIALTQCSNISPDDYDYFERVYILDELFDELHKKHREELDSIVKKIKT